MKLIFNWHYGNPRLKYIYQTCIQKAPSKSRRNFPSGSPVFRAHVSPVGRECKHQSRDSEPVFLQQVLFLVSLWVLRKGAGWMETATCVPIFLILIPKVSSPMNQGSSSQNLLQRSLGFLETLSGDLQSLPFSNYTSVWGRLFFLYFSKNNIAQ